MSMLVHQFQQMDYSGTGGGGGGVHSRRGWGEVVEGVYGKSLYLPLNFAMNLKLLHKIKSGGLPRWHSGWESACQRRVHGFKPWSRKIPYAREQLSSCATTTEPVL